MVENSNKDVFTRKPISNWWETICKKIPRVIHFAQSGLITSGAGVVNLLPCRNSQKTI